MKPRNVFATIVLVLIFIGGYGLWLTSAIKQHSQDTYRFHVNDPVWIVEGNRPGIVYRVNPSAPFEDLRYLVSYFSRDTRQIDWMKEGSLDPLTNQMSRTSHE